MQDNTINKTILSYRNLKIVWYNQITSKEEELLEITRESIEFSLPLSDSRNGLEKS